MFAGSDPDLRCYVRGCKAPIVGGALHRDFGRVNCCADHWPERGARARVFGDHAAPAGPTSDHFAVPAPAPAPVLTVDRPPDLPDPF